MRRWWGGALRHVWVRVRLPVEQVLAERSSGIARLQGKYPQQQLWIRRREGASRIGRSPGATGGMRGMLLELLE